MELREKILKTLDLIKEDADFFIYHFLNPTVGNEFIDSNKKKAFVLNKLSENYPVHMDSCFSDVIRLTEDTGVSLSSFEENIYYETKDIDGFMEVVCDYRPYDNIFVKIDNEHKTITYKLGDKVKTLNLIENTPYVSKPYYKNAMKCVSIEKLEEHIKDKFWANHVISIGRLVLGIKNLVD